MQRRPLFPIEVDGIASEKRKNNAARIIARFYRILQIDWKIITSGLCLTLFGVIWYYPAFFFFFLFVLYSIILIALAVAGTVYIHYIFTSNEAVKPRREASNILYNVTKSSVFDVPNPIKNPSNLPLVFGKTVDLQLQQIIEYVLRDFISPWLGNVVTKPKLINDVVRADLWNAIQKIHARAIRIDPAKLIAVDMINRVTVHLEKIRIAEARAAETGMPVVFSTNSYLTDEEKELDFLRKLSEIMIILLLPRGYSLPPLKLLLSEILSYKIFFPIIKMLTSPDYINQKIVQNIETRLATAAISKRSYEYAASFEDFMKIINNSDSLEELSLIRKSIINDLMHATTIQNIQRAKGLDPDSDEATLTKSELSNAMRLKRYVQQLSYAKVLCEKNLGKFGWNGNYANDIDLNLIEILNTAIGRRYLTLFLEPLKASGLVGLYVAIDEMKQSSENQWHQLGTEIFYTYIRVPKSEIQIEKHYRKQIETFLLGDTGPDIFFDLQKQVLKTLEEKYYQSFVLSEQYQQLKEALDNGDFKDPTLLQTHDDNHEFEVPSSLDCSVLGNPDIAAIGVAAHTSYAKKRIEKIQKRIDKKNQALDALKSSMKPESKLLQILEKEMDWLKSEKRQTEAHLRRTDAWTEHLGKWKASIQSVEISDEKESLQFMILVHVDEDINVSAFSTTKLSTDEKPNTKINHGSISSGWVVMRSLSQVQDLHRKLRHVSTHLKSLDLPNNFKLFFVKNDKHALEKAKHQIQKFLNIILEDDHLNGSEAIYTFLSPSSDHLKQTLPSPKKSKFSLSTLFKSDVAKQNELCNKSNEIFGGFQRDDDDISTYLDGDNTDNKLFVDIEGKDSIAEPLYALMGEIFDMGGVFKWLRKSIISFVQITYGRTINRQIRESVACLFEESMLHTYFSAILKSFWPGGLLASSYPVRSEDMKEMTTNAAKALLMDNIPEVLCNLVGAHAAKCGILKVFDSLQNPLYNKQLFYELLEIIVIDVFPEIKQLKIKENNQKQKNTSNTSNNAASTTTISASLSPLNIVNNHYGHHQNQHNNSNNPIHNLE